MQQQMGLSALQLSASQQQQLQLQLLLQQQQLQFQQRQHLQRQQQQAAAAQAHLHQLNAQSHQSHSSPGARQTHAKHEEAGATAHVQMDTALKHAEAGGSVTVPQKAAKRKSADGEAGAGRKRSKVKQSPDSEGQFPCSSCEKRFDSRAALSGHSRFCTRGEWRCEWCRCKETETTSKAQGPSGGKTLCNACGSRFRAGHRSMPEKNEEGKFLCPDCSRPFATISALGGHKRFCDAGNWRCAWCECKQEECSGKGPGPAGARTLCSVCSSRHRTGHSKPPSLDKEGKFVCPECDRKFDSIGALSGHKRFCDGGSWRCGWCSCRCDECSGKGPGPDGAKTLCSACSSRFRNGHTGPPSTSDDGKFVCERCTRQFDSIGALGGHKRFCDMGTWRCGWCEVRADECSGKGPGPAGPKTLCSACSARFRAGHTAPPLRDADGNFLCDSCNRAFVSMGALGGHRRFCGQLSTAVAPRLQLVDDLTLVTPDDLGVALPSVPATRLPAAVQSQVLAAFDFLSYFFRAVVPKSTLLKVDASLLRGPEAGDELLPPPQPEAQVACLLPAPRGREKSARSGGRKKSKRPVWEEQPVEPSAALRRMLEVLQASEWEDWEHMLLTEAAEPTPLLHAFHVLCTHFLLIELLAPGTAKAGAQFCASLGENAEKLLGGVPVNANTWPELLRMILLARSVAQAPKKRAVALTAMLGHGSANASVAATASAALGGGHSVSVWSVSSSAAAGEADSLAEEADAEGEGDFDDTISQNGDWSAISDALGVTTEYADLPLPTRCTIVECLAQLVMETPLCSGYFEASSRAAEKLQDLKRQEYKNRNAKIESEEQAKLALKYNIQRPAKLSHDRRTNRKGSTTAPAAEEPRDGGLPNNDAQPTDGAGEADLPPDDAMEEGPSPPNSQVAAAEAETAEADRSNSLEQRPQLQADPSDNTLSVSVASGQPSVVGEASKEGLVLPADQRLSRKQHVRRGDLDTMRLRKDELRKQLDVDFQVLIGRIGRLRQEPIGLDRDRREYMLLGGPPDGQQPLADLSRLLVRRRGNKPDDLEEWIGITNVQDLNTLMASLRTTGEREHCLHKVLEALKPKIEKSMASKLTSRAPEPMVVLGGEEGADEGADEGAVTTARKGSFEWHCRATRYLEAMWSEDMLQLHREECRAAVGEPSSRGTMLRRLKLDFLDVAVAAPLPVDMQGDAARTHWLPLVAAAADPQQVADLLIEFVRILPRSHLVRTPSIVKPWWPAEGDKEPPVWPQADSVHQVAMRLYTLDYALTY